MSGHKIKAELRIRELMVENKIRSVSALHRLLIARRVTVSHSQLLRIVDNKAEHWKVEFIEAFAELFNCSVQDLFRFENVPVTEVATETAIEAATDVPAAE